MGGELVVSPKSSVTIKESIMKIIGRILIRSRLMLIVIGLHIVKLNAQAGGSPVRVSITVTPPYSTNTKDYIQQGNNVMVTISNLSSVPQQVTVVLSITGTNGVKAALRNNYQPPAGLMLGPNQVRILTLNQLRAINNTVTANDIIVETITREDYLNSTPLPEGLYTVCATAKDFNLPTSFEEKGCATFVINSYDPPIILNPMANTTVRPLNPQFINFGWTPSGIAGRTRYSFKLFDLTSVQVNNPNDAFEYTNIRPFYQQTNIVVSNLLMDNSKPKLKEGNTYALQVVAYDPQNRMLYKNKGRSQVILFTYRNEPVMSTIFMDDPRKAVCVGPTNWNGSLPATDKHGLPDGTPLAIGGFVVRNTIFTKNNDGYDGTGEILVNFLNTKLKVEFKNLRVNTNHRVFKGLVTAVVVNRHVINDSMSRQKNGTINKVPDLKALTRYLADDARNISTLDASKQPADLPLHTNNNGFTIGIIGVMFEPTEAYINTVMNVWLDSTRADHLLLSRKNIAVHPNGFADDEMKIWLQEDAMVYMANGATLNFRKDKENTFATFDCNGFKKINIKGEIVRAAERSPFQISDITGEKALRENINIIMAGTISKPGIYIK
jgi:hypothetical protein